ncbi:MAG: pilus assembly protein PilM [Candidatus Omnitrophota bacterium]
MMQKRYIATVEITDSHVKVVQAKIRRGARLLTFCDAQRIQLFTDEEVSKLLSTTTASVNISAANIIGVIPRRFAILKHMTLPSHSDQEIRKMIDLQISSHVPYSREDIVFDYAILEKVSSGYTNVLIIIVHKDVINRYLKIFNSAGINPSKLTLSSIGLLNWFTYQENKWKGKEKGPVALAYIDEANSEICFFDNGKLIFSRNIAFGARDLSVENLPNFIKPLHLTMETYRQEAMGPEISRIFIVSALPEAALLQERLKENFSLQVEVLNPMDNLPCPKRLNLPGVSDRPGLSLAIGLGLVLSSEEVRINLMPPELKVAKSTKLRNRQKIKIALATAATVILGGLAYGVDIYRDSAYLAKLEKESARLRPQVEGIEEQTRLMNFGKKQMAGRILVADLFYELYDLTPADITFQSLSLDDKGWMVVHGYSRAGASVNDFQNKLVNSPLFKEVSLQYATKLKIFAQEFTDFKITCQIARDEKGVK